MKRLIVILVLLGTAMTLTSCNMISGAGKDVGAVGDAVRNVTN